MRNWGIVVTSFYTVVVTFLFTYELLIVAFAKNGSDLNWGIDAFIYTILDGAWLPILLLICGQALLLFLSVDTSWRRIKPRQHVSVTATVVGFASLLLTGSILFAIGAVYLGDDIFDHAPLSSFDVALQLSAPPGTLAMIVLVWAAWAVLFYAYSKRVSNVIESAVSWLIRGSVLELLIAVPCHIVVRQRGDCSAPGVTAFGIATGIAIMLMAFGPSILFLYRRKLGGYREPRLERTPGPD